VRTPTPSQYIVSILALLVVLNCQSGASTGQLSTISGSQNPPAHAARVLVVPFSNISGETRDAWIGSGIAKTIAADLRQLGFSVVSQTVSPEKMPPDHLGLAADTHARQLAQEAGATWIVGGEFQRLGNQIRLVARIIDTSRTTIPQTVTLDDTIDNLFKLQDQVVPLLEHMLRLPRPSNAGNPDDVTSQEPSRTAVDRRQALSSNDSVSSQIGDTPRVTIRRTSDPPRIDGRLDDAVWQTATHITKFVQIAPVAGAPGSEDTEVWMAYDSDNLYFAFYAHYDNPGMMRVNWGDRDETGGDDQMAVMFDTFLDQQRAYQFEVNGYGVQTDSLVNAEGTRSSSSRRASSSSSSVGSSYWRQNSSSGSSLSSSGSFGVRGDRSWNALFDTDGKIVDDGWTAEMAIPFKSLRYPTRASDEAHLWGFQITRRVRGLSEAVSWSPISRDIAGQLTQFGILEGLEGLSESRNLEILPELTGVTLGSMNRDTGTYNRRDPEGDVGLGFKYGITPNLTADFTYNPDFSQIEADQPQIETNQRFALFYPEQRPFFLEGQEIFQTSTPITLLNTRTIVDPRFGGKLTGKVGNTTFGVVVADDEAPGLLSDQADSQFGSTAQTVVGRARYDFYSESYLGAIMTAREFGQEYNRVGGIDGRFRIGQTHRMSFMAVGSSTQNEAEGTVGGGAFEFDLTRQGRNLGYSASYGSIDPEFRAESGFIPRVDLRQATGTVSYRWWPESTLLTWQPSFTYFRLYDYAGVLQDEQIQSRTNFQFRNNVSITGTVSRDLERFRALEFRKTGYGLDWTISGRTLSLYGGFNVGDGIYFSDNPYLGDTATGNINVMFRPNSRMQIRMTSIFSRFTNPMDDVEVFDVRIYRTRTTFQFTNRFLLRHILEHNTQAVTLGNNLLLTYRINSGTVLFLGYDDRYQRGTRINNVVFPMTTLQRTNRALFTKFSYLFRL
jgi:TolB-like protein